MTLIETFEKNGFKKEQAYIDSNLRIMEVYDDIEINSSDSEISEDDNEDFHLDLNSEIRDIINKGKENHSDLSNIILEITQIKLDNNLQMSDFLYPVFLAIASEIEILYENKKGDSDFNATSSLVSILSEELTYWKDLIKRYTNAFSDQIILIEAIEVS